MTIDASSGQGLLPVLRARQRAVDDAVGGIFGDTPASTSPGIRRSNSGSWGMAGASGARSQAECDPGNHEPWGFGPPRRDGRVGGAAS